MSHPAVRVIVFLVAAASVAAGGYFLVGFEEAVVAERGAERVFESQAHEAAVLVERLRTAQQSYVAEGQGADYWMGKLADTRASLERTLGNLASTATAEGAQLAAGRALALLGQHARLDERARTYMKQEQRLMASDLIFTEISGMTGEIGRHIDQARTEQRTASDSRIEALRQQQVYLMAGAAALTVLCALLLAVGSRPSAQEDAGEALGVVMNDGSPAGAASLRGDQVAAAGIPGASTSTGHMVRAASVIPIGAAGSAASLRGTVQVDLSATARLCADLARVGDPAELPALLQRAGRVIDASGLIVWVADRAGASLFPVLAEGYAPDVLARMGSIGRDADNAAAAAYRQGELRTVAAHGALPGAIVAPSVTGEGCIGVLAAEMRHGAERDEATQAIAAILAAQLATFVTALPAGQQVE
jgi:hypothetical protein